MSHILLLPFLITSSVRKIHFLQKLITTPHLSISLKHCHHILSDLSQTPLSQLIRCEQIKSSPQIGHFQTRSIFDMQSLTARVLKPNAEESFGSSSNAHSFQSDIDQVNSSGQLGVILAKRLVFWSYTRFFRQSNWRPTIKWSLYGNG